MPKKPNEHAPLLPGDDAPLFRHDLAAERIRILFTADVAEQVRGRVWGDDQVIEEKNGGGLILEVTPSNASELYAWVTGFGGKALFIKQL